MIDCRSVENIEATANVMKNILENFTDGSLNSFARQLVTAKLMNVKLPWYIRAIAFIRRFDTNTTLYILFNMKPEIARDTIQSAIDHLVNGTDQTDDSNPGGFNQEELETLAEIVLPYAIELNNYVNSVIATQA